MRRSQRVRRVAQQSLVTKKAADGQVEYLHQATNTEQQASNFCYIRNVEIPFQLFFQGIADVADKGSSLPSTPGKVFSLIYKTATRAVIPLWKCAHQTNNSLIPDTNPYASFPYSFKNTRMGIICIFNVIDLLLSVASLVFSYLSVLKLHEIEISGEKTKAMNPVFQYLELGLLMGAVLLHMLKDVVLSSEHDAAKCHENHRMDVMEQSVSETGGLTGGL